MLRHRCLLVIALALLMYTTGIAAGDPDSVNIINALPDLFVLHCSSKEDDFGQTAVYPKTAYYWKINPNIFGRTSYSCEFLWGTKRQEFPVWQGSYYDERPKCCLRGPCAYKVSPEGIYISLYSETDDQSLAESWALYRTWQPNPLPSN